MLPEQKLQTSVEWSLVLGRVKEIMIKTRVKEQTEDLIEATRKMSRAVELSYQFPRNDVKRFITLSTVIALYCHLRCYGYVEFDRQLLLRMSKRYPRPIFGDILNSLGMLYQEHGRVDEAVQLYRRAIKLLPTSHPRFNLLISNLDSLTKTCA